MTGARACSGTIEIREFSGLNEARLDCFRRYAREHFYNEFRAEQGTEVPRPSSGRSRSRASPRSPAAI